MIGDIGTERIAILVLGMHRSGTSALTWLVGELGASLPADAIVPSRENSRGYFESASIVQADDQLLRVARSSWFDPRPLDLSRLAADALRSRLERMREAVRTAYGEAGMIVLKDPRQCRFVPVVTRVLAEEGFGARAVLMLRPAAEVASSIRRRDGTSAGYAHLLWLRHMVDAERATREMPRTVVSYDGLLADWREPATKIARLMGRAGWAADEAMTGRVERFLDPALRNHRHVEPEPLEPPLRDIVCAIEQGFSRLQMEDDADARSALDDAYARFDDVPWLVNDIIHDELRHRRMPSIEEDAAPVPRQPDSSDPSPVGAEASRPLAAPREPGSDAALIAASGLFDVDWYLAVYPDVAASGIDPVEHYLTVGAAEGRNPSPLFNTSYYARQMVRRMTAVRSGS